MKKTLIIPIFTVFFLNAIAQESELKWTPEFCMNFKSINSTSLSPDGQHVAYVVRTPVMDGEKSEYLQQVWVASVKDQMNVEYTKADKSSFAPAFSPNGEYLAFLSARSGKNQIWRMRLMGGEAEQLTDVKKGVGRFQWSPDGQRIAFTSADPDSEEEEKARKEKRAVIVVDQNFKYNHLYTVAMNDDHPEKKKIKRITAGNFHVTNFDWAPNGQTIVFSYNVDPKLNTNFIAGDIALVPADSGQVKQLVNRPGPDTNPKFSPDGRSIAFASSGGQPEPIGLMDLYIVDVEGGSPTALKHTPNRSVGLMGWAHDSKSLIVSEAIRTNRVALQVPIDPQGETVVLTPDTGASSSIDFNSEKDVIAYVYQTVDQPAEVYVSSFGNKDIRAKVSAIHSDIELPKMGKTDVLQWRSKDGLEIEGLITYPVHYEKGKKYPVILQIHGGPAGVFSETFTGAPAIYMTQYFAERGFVVVRPNPRGSTGYGREFRYANFKDWGYGDYEDVMSGVDKVLEMGIGDEDRMAVMGWSYGGYMTSFLVTKTNRFKAASMGAGLPNLVSMTTTTDIPDYLVGHMGGEFWDDYDTFEKHSAMYRISNVVTPTQVIHGEKDLRVPFTQGQEFYVALKRRGVDTEMLVLPRTPHGPREPKLLMAVSPRILSWFDKYINTKP